MDKRKIITTVALLCTVMLVSTTLQVSARKTITPTENTQKFMDAYAVKYTSFLNHFKETMMKNSTKQLLRIALFLIILGVALVKIKGDIMTLTLKTTMMKHPMKIELSLTKLLLVADGLLLLMILKNRNKP